MHEVEDQAERLTYDIETAARILGMGRNAAYDAARRGEIPTIRIGRRLFVPKERLARLLSGEAA